MTHSRQANKKPESMARHLSLAAVRGWCAGVGRSAADFVLRLLLDR
ncbi:hypothetical protein ABZU86_34850 [Streptomyces sp. NPDC005271]